MAGRRRCTESVTDPDVPRRRRSPSAPLAPTDAAAPAFPVRASVRAASSAISTASSRPASVAWNATADPTLTASTAITCGRLTAPVGPGGSPTRRSRATAILVRAPSMAHTNPPGSPAANPTLMSSTAKTSSAFCAFGSTNGRSLVMTGSAAARAGPVTDAAAAPAARTGDAEDSRASVNVSGAVPIASGTVAAPCSTKGQIRLQYCNGCGPHAPADRPVQGRPVRRQWRRTH